MKMSLRFAAGALLALAPLDFGRFTTCSASRTGVLHSPTEPWFRRAVRLFGRGVFRVDRRECSVIVTADSQRCRGGMRHPKASTVPIASPWDC